MRSVTDEERERLARASWEASKGYITGISWEYVKDNIYRGGAEYLRVDAILRELERIEEEKES